MRLYRAFFYRVLRALPICKYLRVLLKIPYQVVKVIPKTKKLTGILSAKANVGIDNAIFNTINKSCNYALVGIIPNIIDIRTLSVQKSIICNTIIAKILNICNYERLSGKLPYSPCTHLSGSVCLCVPLTLCTMFRHNLRTHRHLMSFSSATK